MADKTNRPVVHVPQSADAWRISALRSHKYGALLNLRVPHWGMELVQMYRTAALIPNEISDLLIFVAMEQYHITSMRHEDQVPKLRDAFGLPFIEYWKLVDDAGT